MAKDRTEKPQYAPGEVIIKLREKNLPQLTYNQTYSERASSHEDTLSAVKAKYNLKDEKPVFKTLHDKLKANNLSQMKLDAKELKKSDTILKHKETVDLLPIYLLKTNEDVLSICEKLKKDPNIEYTEPNYIMKIQTVPDDPYYHSQGSWGQAYDDLWGIKKIQCEKAWDISQGEGVIVAVIDTGVDYNHEDLADNIWTNDDEIPDNGIDDDNNGYIDDSRGWDFAYGDNDPMDGAGHGTHVSGTIAAVGNNNIGVIGVAPKAKIMAVKGLDDSGSGWVSDLADCVYYAVDNGANILSNSWGGQGTSQVLTDAFHYADSKHCVTIAAAGNNNFDTAFFVPANIDTVIAVAATDSDDNKADFSNWGTKIDVAAPGVDILSLRASGTDMYGDGIHVVDDKYYRSNGTSMACPHAAGLAALILSKNPALASEEIRDIIRLSADDLGDASFDVSYGYGRINTYGAVAFLEGNEPRVLFCKSVYGTYDTAEVLVVDKNRNLDPDIRNTLNVTLRSDTETEPIHIALTETEANIGIFKGSIMLDEGFPLGDDKLQVNLRDRIYVEYIDSFGNTYINQASIMLSTVTLINYEPSSNRSNSFVITAVDENETILGAAYLHSNRESLYVKEGLIVKFRVYHNYDLWGESEFVSAPANVSVNTDIQPSIVTVSKDGKGVENVIIEAYNKDGNWLTSYSYTDSSGRAYCYLKEGIQVKFKAYYNNVFAGETDLVTTPADVTINFPRPSIVTVLKDGVGVPNVSVGAFGSRFTVDAVYWGSSRTDSSGNAYFYIKEGTAAQFRAYYEDDFAGETDFVITPSNLTINLPTLSVVTLLKDGVGVSNVEIEVVKMDEIGRPIPVGYYNYTDSQGKAYFYLKEGMRVGFKAYYPGVQTDFVITPANETINLRESVVTVLNSGVAVTDVSVMAYDTDGIFLGDVNTNFLGKAYFYPKEGAQVKFLVYYGSTLNGPVQYYSGFISTPEEVTIDVGNQPPRLSSVTVRENGNVSFWIKVDAYDRNNRWLGYAYRNTWHSGGNIIFLEEGIEVKFKVTDINGWEYESEFVTTPAHIDIDIKKSAFFVTILKDGAAISDVRVVACDTDGYWQWSSFTDSSGKARFYLPEGMPLNFKLYYYDDFAGETEFLTMPADVTINMPATSVVALLGDDMEMPNVFVEARDLSGECLGWALVDTSGKTSFYIKEGMKVKFRVNYEGKDYWSNTITTPGKITIDIRDNKPPTLKFIGNREILIGHYLLFPVSATDPDGDRLKYGADNLPKGAVFISISEPLYKLLKKQYPNLTYPCNLFYWQPKGNQVGQYKVTFWVEDLNEIGNPKSRTQEEITITVKRPQKRNHTLPTTAGFSVKRRDFIPED